MATLVNSFEGGTSGTTISAANSGGASGNPFDAVSVGSGCTLAFDNTVAAHGLLSCKVATAGTANASNTEWTTSEGTQTTIWYRCYLYFTANPGALCLAFRAQSGSSRAGGMQISTSGQIQLYNGANSVVATFMATIPLNQWFRVEGLVTGDPAAGVLSAAQYNSMDSDTPTESHTVSSQNTTGALTQYWFGQCAALANTGPFWMDDLGVSSTGYLGPVVNSGSGASGGIVAVLVASGTI